jgi:hypothetical protein
MHFGKSSFKVLIVYDPYLDLIQSTIPLHQETCFITSIRIRCVRQLKLNGKKFRNEDTDNIPILKASQLSKGLISVLSNKQHQLEIGTNLVSVETLTALQKNLFALFRNVVYEDTLLQSFFSCH